MSETSTLSSPSSQLKTMYPWLIVGSGLLVLIVTNGLTTSSLSVFDEVLTNEFHLSRPRLKIKESITNAVAALFILLSGWLIDRIGVKKLLMAGMIFMAVALSLYSQVTAVWQIYGLHVILGFALVTAGSVPVIILVSTWFRKQRGLALGITLVGTSLGSAIFPPLLTHFIQLEGWRNTLLGLSLPPLVLLGVVALVVRNAPLDIHSVPWGNEEKRVDEEKADLLHLGVDYKDAIKTPIFWLISGCGMLSFFAVVGLTSNLFLHLRSLNYTPASSAGVLSLYFVLALTGKFAISFLSDYIDIYKIFTTCFIGLAIGAGVVSAVGPDMVTLGVGIAAVSWGGIFTLYNILIVRTFGLKAAGKINGSINFWESIGSFLGPVVTGWWFQQAGSYRPVFAFIAGAVGVAALLSLLFKRLKPTKSY